MPERGTTRQEAEQRVTPEGMLKVAGKERRIFDGKGRCGLRRRRRRQRRCSCKCSCKCSCNQAAANVRWRRRG